MSSTDSPHPATAAVLALMPIFDGETLVEVETITTQWGPDEYHDPNVPDEYEAPVFGEPEPLAAQYAAAVLHWAAKEVAKLCDHADEALDEECDYWRAAGHLQQTVFAIDGTYARQVADPEATVR